ncbi:MAG: hypothetical protein SFT81_00330 [Candidatus Caenarcaniphilales bacterium]|nr:hypothetical protein [Candidatus Caenarcaniphilales bacterium]
MTPQLVIDADSPVSTTFTDPFDDLKDYLEDLAIISVMNYPGAEEDYFVAWLDFEISDTGRGNDLETDRAKAIEDY